MSLLSLGQATLFTHDGFTLPLSISDFASHATTIDFVAKQNFLSNNICLFKLTYPNYEIEVNIFDGRVFIKRNGLYQHSEQYLGTEPYDVAVQWDVNSIACGIAPQGSDMNKAMRAVQTPKTLPPLGLIRDLKCGNQNARNSYPSIDALFARVLDCISFCEQDIRRYGAEKFLWTANGDTIQPLVEPEITRLVASYLAIYGAVNNFEVACESRTGNGSLDFCIYGHIDGIGLAKIAIEAKKANSADIEHGFTHQLPAYMERLETRHGIYLVYWLKSDRYPQPNFNSYSDFEINKLHPLKRGDSVRTMCIDLSLDRSPSRL